MRSKQACWIAAWSSSRSERENWMNQNYWVKVLSGVWLAVASEEGLFRLHQDFAWPL